MFKPEDVIKYFAFHYWHSKEFDQRVDGWKIHDTYEFGRCFTLEPSDKYVQKGIRKIVSILLANSTIFTHTAGMFLKENDGGQTRQEKYFELGNDYKLFLTYEYHESLDVDYGGDSCKNDIGYSKDLCTEKLIEKESIEKFGCITPFGLDKNNICQEGDKINKSLKIYKDAIYWDHFNRGCFNPCSIFSITTTKSFETKWKYPHYSFIEINFPKVVKVYERSYTYSGLSLIAEIGGYVGLFLGISVNQVINGLDFLISKFERFYQC